MKNLEMEGEDGSKLTLGAENRVFGRGSAGFHNNKDLTVSRRHVSFELVVNNNSEEIRVSFEVIGRNPFWVWSSKDGGGALTLFRNLDKGQLELGDRFSFSGNSPIWFHLNHPCLQKNQVAETQSPDLDIDQMDLSRIHLVKEFGFLVMGHEFDNYPKGMIRNVKDWRWFLDEPSKDDGDEDEDDDEGKEQRKMSRRKRKKGNKDNDEDEEWGGESEDDKDPVAKVSKGKRPLYSTRSKDSKRGPNSDDTRGGATSSKRKKSTNVKDDDDNDEDDDDETIGGFIVDDEEDDKEDEEEEMDEEEEEFEDDYDDD